jgi:hypothetical protein
MKRKYDPAKLEIIVFGAYDVITTSDGGAGGGDSGSSEKETDKGIFGGGYNPNGWT